LTREPVSGIGHFLRPAVDLAGESAYARASFDTFEESSAGIALARADRTFCCLWPCYGTDQHGSGRKNE
jgi:hypothetical protein